MNKKIVLVRKWFTLIEMMVVIVIIAILMTMVFRFGGDRLQQLQLQTSKETILWFREDVINNNRTSSYIGADNYDSVTVEFSDGSSQLHARYSNAGDIIYQESSSIFQWLSWKLWTQDGTILDQLMLRYTPYQLECDISDQTTSYSWAVLALIATANPHRYCFAIQYQTCSMQEIVCPAFTD